MFWWDGFDQSVSDLCPLPMDHHNVEHEVVDDGACVVCVEGTGCSHLGRFAADAT